MGQRIRAVAVLVVLLGAGVLLGSALAQWWQAPPPALSPSPSVSHVPGRVRVEVLNGGGTTGVARGATRVLRDLGWDVVYYGNAENFSQEPSVVVDRVGRLDVARMLADALGIQEVVSAPDSGLFVDVTVSLGPEWAPPGDPTEEAVSAPAWWDLRRFFKRQDHTESTGP